MKALAVYYTDPIEGRQKFVIPNPSDIQVEHYLWCGQHIMSVPNGHALGLFGARMEYPARGPFQDWLLDRDRVGTIRLEEIDEPPTPSKLWE